MIAALVKFELLAVGMVCLAGLARADVASFQGLGDLPGGPIWSDASDISADGSTVLGRSDAAGGLFTYVWTRQAGMQPIATSEQHGWAISGDGSVVAGGGFVDGHMQAFRWTAETGVLGLGDLPGGGFSSTARGISDGGQVIVGESVSDNGWEAFRWTEDGGMVGLGSLPGPWFESHAYDASADGSVIVGESRSEFGTEGFRWTETEGMVGLGFLHGEYGKSQAFGVSADGTVIVGLSWNSMSDEEPVRWTAETGWVGLGSLLPRVNGAAYGVSADGSRIVGRSGNDAFIWDAVNGMRNFADVLTDEFGLDLTGWHLGNAVAISSDSCTIAGSGSHDGDVEAWVAVIPEPASLTALACAGLLAMRRRACR